jgi:uncharacterized protein YqeY
MRTETLRADLDTALRARDTVRTTTLRSLLSAIQVEEKSGKTERTLGGDEVLRVVARELKKRRESEEVYSKAGREDLAGVERAEAEVISGYLPEALGEAEVKELVATAIKTSGAAGVRHMGAAMKAATALAAGRVDGKTLSAEVRAQLV